MTIPFLVQCTRKEYTQVHSLCIFICEYVYFYGYTQRVYIYMCTQFLYIIYLYIYIYEIIPFCSSKRYNHQTSEQIHHGNEFNQKPISLHRFLRMNVYLVCIYIYKYICIYIYLFCIYKEILNWLKSMIINPQKIIYIKLILKRGLVCFVNMHLQPQREVFGKSVSLYIYLVHERWRGDAYQSNSVSLSWSL